MIMTTEELTKNLIACVETEIYNLEEQLCEEGKADLRCGLEFETDFMIHDTAGKVNAVIVLDDNGRFCDEESEFVFFDENCNEVVIEGIDTLAISNAGEKAFKEVCKIVLEALADVVEAEAYEMYCESIGDEMRGQ